MMLTPAHEVMIVHALAGLPGAVRARLHRVIARELYAIRYPSNSDVARVVKEVLRVHVGKVAA